MAAAQSRCQVSFLLHPTLDAIVFWPPGLELWAHVTTETDSTLELAAGCGWNYSNHKMFLEASWELPVCKTKIILEQRDSISNTTPQTSIKTNEHRALELTSWSMLWSMAGLLYFSGLSWKLTIPSFWLMLAKISPSSIYNNNIIIIRKTDETWIYVNRRCFNTMRESTKSSKYIHKFVCLFLKAPTVYSTGIYWIPSTV